MRDDYSEDSLAALLEQLSRGSDADEAGSAGKPSEAGADTGAETKILPSVGADNSVREMSSGEGASRLPVTAVTDEEDDGIFMNWPEPDTGGEDTDGPEGTDGGSTKPDGGEDEDYAFRRAAASDYNESVGRKPKKPKKTKREEENEEALSAVKYYRHTQKVKDMLLRRVLPLILILSFSAGFFLYFFRLRHLTFDDLEGYDTADVFRASGIRKNMFIFSVKESDIRRRLAMDFPYIEDIDVELTLPDTVHLIFTEDRALFYTKIYDEYFVISQSMRVLSRCTDEKEIPEGLKCITLPAVSYAVVGYGLTFFDSSYVEFLSAFLEKIETFSYYSHVDSLDLSNRSYLSLTYEERLTVDIGSSEDIDTKLLFVKAILEALDGEDRGTITLIDNKKATFSPAQLTASGS